MHSFTVEIRGHRYQGAWRQLDDRRVEVRSDYGRQLAYLDGRSPGEAARAVLARMVPGFAG